MLSYRHSYHAGNHADVLKHAIQLALLDYLKRKEKPFWVIDTHAGAGRYALDSAHATKLGEFRDGIGRLWTRDDLPEMLRSYVEAVRALNPDGRLQAYPGSPWLSRQALREQDRLRLFELHSTDVELLAQTFEHQNRQVQITRGDGFQGLKALLPPPPRRALVLIDPSYELKEDYDRVILALRDAMTRFPTGTYAIWYPQLARPEARNFVARLKTVSDADWLNVSLSVRPASTIGPGMHGSGMFILNPPWTLHDELSTTLPWLQKCLAQEDGAACVLEQQIR